MDSRTRFFFSVMTGFCAAVIFCCTLFALFVMGPALETKFMPAVSKLQILSLYWRADDQAVVMAEFTKLRAECEYVGIAWYKGGLAGFERVPVILQRQEGDTSSPNRPPGTQRAGPWIIGMTPDELRQNSFARLTHRCHPFWITTTDFWP